MANERKSAIEHKAIPHFAIVLLSEVKNIPNINPKNEDKAINTSIYMPCLKEKLDSNLISINHNMRLVITKMGHNCKYIYRFSFRFI
jgi:hypothetical protein